MLLSAVVVSFKFFGGRPRLLALGLSFCESDALPPGRGLSNLSSLDLRLSRCILALTSRDLISPESRCVLLLLVEKELEEDGANTAPVDLMFSDAFLAACRCGTTNKSAGNLSCFSNSEVELPLLLLESEVVVLSFVLDNVVPLTGLCPETVTDGVDIVDDAVSF